MLTMPYMSQDAAGDVMLYGWGAGAMPTASSVVGISCKLRVTLKLKARGSAIPRVLISKYYLQKTDLLRVYDRCENPMCCQRR